MFVSSFEHKSANIPYILSYKSDQQFIYIQFQLLRNSFQLVHQFCSAEPLLYSLCWQQNHLAHNIVYFDVNFIPILLISQHFTAFASFLFIFIQNVF